MCAVFPSPALRYAMLGKKFEGMRLLILDEIAMISLESLHFIEREVAAAMATLGETPDEKHDIELKPFGGLHVVFSGDLYQLPPVDGKPVYASNLGGKPAVAFGKTIWNMISEYHELTDNLRVKLASLAIDTALLGVIEPKEAEVITAEHRISFLLF